jgi:hypothetical protein
MAFLVLVLLLIVLALAQAAGLTADSRDGADWRPSDGGFRQPPGGPRRYER